MGEEKKAHTPRYPSHPGCHAVPTGQCGTLCGLLRLRMAREKTPRHRQKFTGGVRARRTATTAPHAVRWEEEDGDADAPGATSRQPCDTPYGYPRQRRSCSRRATCRDRRPFCPVVVPSSCFPFFFSAFSRKKRKLFQLAAGVPMEKGLPSRASRGMATASFRRMGMGFASFKATARVQPPRSPRNDNSTCTKVHFTSIPLGPFLSRKQTKLVETGSGLWIFANFMGPHYSIPF